MSADNPTEYIEELQAQNRDLRQQIIKLVAEKQALMLELARENAAKLKAEEAHSQTLNNLHEAWQQ